MDRDEFRQPLWVHLTLLEYKALKLSEAPNLPDGYRYERTVCSGSGGRTQTRVQMVELHVDDADVFDAYRAASPYGGDFSVRSGLACLPSAPPPDLPNPAEDTLSTWLRLRPWPRLLLQWHAQCMLHYLWGRRPDLHLQCSCNRAT